MTADAIPLQAFLTVAAFLFCIGVWGLINSRNAVRVLMSIELMLNAVNLNLMAFSNRRGGSRLGDFALPLSQPRNGGYGAIQSAALVIPFSW